MTKAEKLLQMMELKDPEWMSGPEVHDPDEGILHLKVGTSPEVLKQLMDKINAEFEDAEAQDQSEPNEPAIGIFFWNSDDYAKMIEIVGEHLELAEPSLEAVKRAEEGPPGPPEEEEEPNA